jgi:outer membrane lipoprotein-sorting protein
MFAFIALAQSDSKAKEILDKVANQFKSHPATEIEFTLTMENPEEDIKEEHAGKAWLKGNKYKLNLMDVENYYNGEVIFTYMPEVQEVTIKNPTEEEEGFLNPVTLFNIHNQGFNQKLVSTTDGITYIELFPIAEKNFQKIGIWVNVSTLSIQKVTSFGKDGNQVTITIKKIKSLNPVPEDSFFSFDKTKHPDVEVVDMR